MNVALLRQRTESGLSAPELDFLKKVFGPTLSMFPGARLPDWSGFLIL